LANWEAHEQSVTSLAHLRNSNVLVSGCSDGTFKLWDLDVIRQGLVQFNLDW
jgi:WD40 repeat protein